MSADFTVWAALTLITCTAGITSLIAGGIKKPHFKSRRIVVGLLCLTGAVITASAALLLPNVSESMRSIQSFDLWYFSILIILTICAVIFYRTVLVFLIFIYITIFCLSLVFAYTGFGQLRAGNDIHLSSRDGIIHCSSEGVAVPSFVSDDSATVSEVFFVQYIDFKPPARLLVPFPQHWKKLYALVPYIDYFSLTSVPAPSVLADTRFNRFMLRLFSLCTPSGGNELFYASYIEVPFYEFYPVNVKITESGIEKLL